MVVVAAATGFPVLSQMFAVASWGITSKIKRPTIFGEFALNLAAHSIGASRAVQHPGFGSFIEVLCLRRTLNLNLKSQNRSSTLEASVQYHRRDTSSFLSSVRFAFFNCLFI